MDINRDDILLTIAVPTYNRACYLDLCLAQICKQLSQSENFVELIVSNNNSTDNTEEIINKYIKQGYYIRYVNNEVNIGSDGNIAQCFEQAKGKYVLIFGDDDVLLDGALETIINVLKSGEYGIVYLNSYGFLVDYKNELPKNQKKQIVVYNDKCKFIEKVNYYFTYITGNIVNKSILDDKVDIFSFLNTNLVQLGWTFSALFNANTNAYIENYLVATKVDNSGEYKLCKVFGENFNKIMMHFITKGINEKKINIIKKHLLMTFFPSNIALLRKHEAKKNSRFISEDYYKGLYPIYGEYYGFWLYTVPIIILPLFFVDYWLFVLRVIRRVNRGLNK